MPCLGIFETFCFIRARSSLWIEALGAWELAGAKSGPDMALLSLGSPLEQIFGTCVVCPARKIQVLQKSFAAFAFAIHVISVLQPLPYMFSVKTCKGVFGPKDTGPSK